MDEELEEIFIKQMLLPKEELALQTMELTADKIDLQQRIDKAVEILYKRKHVENLLGGVENSNTDKIINILKGDDTNES